MDNATGGPGTELKRILSGLGFTASPECSCHQIAEAMDAWGPDLCVQQMGYIVSAMRKNAEARGLPFLDVAGRLLVRRAIQNARRNA